MTEKEMAEGYYYKTYPVTLNIGEEERKMTFDEWWKDYGKNRDSSEYVVARAAYNAGMEEDFNYATKVINDRDVIINFLKKELIKKTSYRQVMKRQYRELKQKCDALERYIKEIEK